MLSSHLKKSVEMGSYPEPVWVMNSKNNKIVNTYSRFDDSFINIRKFQFEKSSYATAAYEYYRDDLAHPNEHILSENGIRNVDQLLAAGATNIDRVVLADHTGIPLPSIIEFVKLSDLARIPGVKGIRARLYYEAGIDTIEKMADLEPEELHAQVTAYVNSSNFNGIATLPAEAIYTVEKVRELPKIVEY